MTQESTRMVQKEKLAKFNETKSADLVFISFQGLTEDTISRTQSQA